MVTTFHVRLPRLPKKRATQIAVDRALRRHRRGCDDRRPSGRVADLAHRDRRGTPGKEMTKGDQAVEKGARRVQRLAERAAAAGGVRAKLAQPLAEDAAFLRRLKPSLIAARVKGQAPTNQPAGSGAPTAPSTPRLGKRPKEKRGPGGAAPILIVGAALLTGIVLAKVIDWRGHAHPRD